MLKNFTQFLLSALLLTAMQSLQAQSTITQWNFNSVPPDASNSTGSAVPSTGAGILSAVNTTSVFGSGAGSADPATVDNTGMGFTGFPAQGTNPKSAGIQFGAATTGYQNIVISFDLRHSNTGPRHFTIQYSTDNSATTPLWVDFKEDSTMLGDAFVNNRTYNLSAITALNNNANAGFRIVSSFQPGTSLYVPATSTSTYAGTGNWRFDMLTVKGTTIGSDMTPPVAQSFQVTSAATSYVVFSEALSSATATNPANYVFSPALTVINASLSATSDTVYLTHAPLLNGQPYTLTVSAVKDLAMNTMTPASFNALFNGSIPNLVITEIIHSPNDIESIEVYNAGSTAINLGGLKWTNGTSGDFPQVSLAPGTTVTFATSPLTAADALHISPVYTLLNGLGSTEDVLVIRNSLNQVIDSVAYFVGTNGWPEAITGVYGYSIELNSATFDNNVGANWFAPEIFVIPEPSQGIIRASPGAYPTPIVLAISLAGIQAQNRGSRNRIEWNTAAEAPGDLFEIEKSKNGTAFSFLARIMANGLPSVYNFTDEQPYSGTTYYRLKLKHLSGSISYSSVVTAYLKGTEAMLQFYPNPAKDQLTIRLIGQQSNTIVELIDMKGTVLKKISLTNQQTTIDIHQLPAGVYNLRYVDNGQIQSVKFTKE